MSLVHWLLVASLVMVANSAPSTGDVEAAWQNFKTSHGKQYKNLHEEAIRKAIFVNNFDKITAHNKHFQDGLVSYSLKINKFADLTNEEITNTLNGYKKSRVQVSDIDIINFAPDENADIPDVFDWREKGAVTPVKSQGACGSCWTFSATGALEGQYFVKTGELISLSEQNLVDCSFENENSGCDGGDMISAFTYVHNQDAIDSEKSYPYEGVDAECRYDPSGNVTSTRGYSNIEIGNEEDLKAAVATVGPIAVAIDASPEEFGFYEGGIYYSTSCSNGEQDPDNDLNHAVLVIGYGSENGQDYWLVKNSWSTDWGEDGFIKMARNRNNNCGVATAASFPLNY